MTEQEYIDTSDLRSWRMIQTLLSWVSPNDTAKKIIKLCYQETQRLEQIVEIEQEEMVSEPEN